MTTTRTTRISAIMIGIFMAVAVNGSMLWSMNSSAQEVSLTPTTLVTLDKVEIVGHRA